MARCAGLLILLLAFVCTGMKGQVVWAPFRSTAGFLVQYPSNWRFFTTSTDRLDILSTADFAKGVVIAENEAEIIVVERSDSNAANLPDIIARDTRSDSVLSRRIVRGHSAANRCSNLTEVVSKTEMGPGTYEIDTALYCMIRGRIFSTVLRNWFGDARQPEYHQIAVHVAQSIRLAQ